MSFGVAWTADALIVRQPGRPAFRLPWPAVRRLTAVHCWPAVELLVEEQVFVGHPRPMKLLIRGRGDSLPRTADELAGCEAFAADVVALFDDADVPSFVEMERGWVDLPEVPWERADGLPDGERAAGAYRSGGLSRDVVARRVLERKPRGSMMVALRGFFARSGAAPERDTLQKVVVTADRVAVEMWDRTVWRLPLEALAARVEEGGDRVYVFGRRTFLVLSAVEGCPVLEALDARIGARVPAR